MVTQLEAYNYRSLRAVRQSLGRFHVLIGRNVSGKSAFLDVLVFLQDALLGGIDLAVHGADVEIDWFVPCTHKDFRDLLHKGEGKSFTLAVVAHLPVSVQEHFQSNRYDRCRYQVRVGVNASEELMVLDEQLWLLENNAPNEGEYPTPLIELSADESQNVLCGNYLAAVFQRSIGSGCPACRGKT